MTSNDGARELFEILVRARVAPDELTPEEMDGLFRRWSALQKGLAELEPLLRNELEPWTTVSLEDAW